jgi:TonB family protein
MPALLLSMMLFQAAAAGAPAAAGGPITDPQWEDLKVYPGELEKYFPAGARANGESGAAAVECTVSAKGALDACRVLKEEPDGKGFGASAIKVAARFRMKTLTRSGAPAPGRVIRMPIAFKFVWTPQEILSRPSFTITVSPRWLKRLDADALAREYPDEAMRTDREGDTQVTCQIVADGHLTACTLLSENPSGYHFGEATMKLVQKLQLDMNDGAAKNMAGGRINIPVRFRRAALTN